MDYYGTQTPSPGRQDHAVDARTTAVAPVEKRYPGGEKAIARGPGDQSGDQRGQRQRAEPLLTEDAERSASKVSSRVRETSVWRCATPPDAIHQLKEALKKSEVSEHDERAPMRGAEETERHIADIDKSGSRKKTS